MEMKVQGRVRCIKNGDMATNPGIPFHRGFVIDPLNFSLPLSSVMFSLAHFLFFFYLFLFSYSCPCPFHIFLIFSGFFTFLHCRLSLHANLRIFQFSKMNKKDLLLYYNFAYFLFFMVLPTSLNLCLTI